MIAPALLVAFALVSQDYAPIVDVTTANPLTVYTAPDVALDSPTGAPVTEPTGYTELSEPTREASVVDDFAVAATTSESFDPPVTDGIPRWAAQEILTTLDSTASDQQRYAALNRLAATRAEAFLPLYGVLLEIGDLELQRMSVEAIGLVPTPAATKKLRFVAALWPKVVAERAFTALGRQQTDLAAQTLHSLASDKSLTESRKQAAIDALRAFYPEYLASNPVPRAYSSAGVGAYALAGGQLGAVTLLAIGSFGVNPEVSMPLGFLSGAAVGIGAGYVIGDSKRWSTVRGYRALSYQTWGYASGIMLSVAVLEQAGGPSDHAGRIVLSSGALGALAGSYIAHQDDEEFPVEKQILVDVSGIAGGLMATGGMLWAPSFKSATGPLVIWNTAAFTGLIGSRYLLPKLDIDSADAPL